MFFVIDENKNCITLLNDHIYYHSVNFEKEDEQPLTVLPGNKWQACLFVSDLLPLPCKAFSWLSFWKVLQTFERLNASVIQGLCILCFSNLTGNLKRDSDWD